MADTQTPRTPTPRRVTLTAEEVTTVRVDRRSFLSRAVAAGSIAVGAALTAACPGGSGDATDSDSEGGGQ